MLIAELVTTFERVAATRSRSAKVTALAELLDRLTVDEIEPAIGFVSGQPRQGKTGVGWATIAAVGVMPAGTPSLTITDLDTVIGQLGTLAGPGSAGDLPGVARLALVEGAAGLGAVGLELLRPIQPMLASTAVDVAEAIHSMGLCSVEWKLDGARIQAHQSGDTVRLFTRNLNDVTGRLPGVVEAVLALPGRQFVLDGEVLGVGDDERPDLFQHTMSRFGRHDGAGGGLGRVVV